MSESTSIPQGIDPRGPRFGAAITNVFSIIIFFLSLDASTLTIAYNLLILVAFLFAIGAIFGTQQHPFAWIFKTFVKPRLKPASELEDPRPPKFAQAVGLFVSVIGIALHLANVSAGVAIAAAALFAASTLQAYFGFCLGCQIYIGLRRAKIIRA
ncbi:MAG: DUF4395 domain-containing protein [Rhodoluna sp.]